MGISNFFILQCQEVGKDYIFEMPRALLNGIFPNYIESFIILWNPLESFGILWNPLSSLVLIDNFWSFLDALGLESISILLKIDVTGTTGP